MNTGEFYRQLDALYDQGPQAVEQFLTDALEGARGGARVQVLNELGSFYRGVSRYGDSERAFREALDLLEGTGETRAYATVLLNLAGTARLAGRLEESAGLFGRVMELLPQEDYAYVSAVNNLGLVRQAQGRLDEAETLLSDAMGRMEAKGGMSREVATSLNNLAALRLRRGDLAGAEELLDRAMDVYTHGGEDDSHYAAALATQGWLHLRRAEWDRAEEAFARSMELTRRYFGENEDYRSAQAGLEEARRRGGTRT